MNEVKSKGSLWKAVIAVAVAVAFTMPGSAMFITDTTFDNTLLDIYPDSWSVNQKGTTSFGTRDIVWSVTLHFDELSGKIDQVVFGEASDANDGPPPDIYDEPKPPAPMQPYIRGWFDDDLPVPYNLLLKDYRHYSDTDKIWDLYVRWKSSSPDMTNVTISWDITEFNSCEYNSVVLIRYDPFDDEWDFAVNMLTEEEYVYAPRWFGGQWLTDHFQINATGGFENTPPYEPINPSPEDDAVDVLINSNLSWTGGDPDPGDTVTYDVYFGTMNPPPQVVAGQPGTTYEPGTMNYSTHYYWQIVAWDFYNTSTSGSIWDFITEEEPNDPPYPPSAPQPQDGAVDVEIDANLSWVGGDPNPEDMVTYDVYFGTTSPPPQVVWNQLGVSYNPSTMNYNTQYYWKIVSWDNHEETTDGPIWDFTTEPQPNNPPYEPSSPSPSDGATNVPIDADLSWTGGDPDGDPVTYDVYFGTSSPPSKVVSNQTGITYDPGILEYETLYYWQIVAWDDSDASNESPIWSFTTKANNPPNAPSIDGLTEGETGTEYDYTFVATDPDGDDVYYYIDWNDDNVEEWIGPYGSGEEVTVSHTWDEKGTYTIRAKAKDTNDAESDWGTLEVTMPVSYNSLFLRFLERFPNAFPILRHLLGL